MIFAKICLSLWLCGYRALLAGEPLDLSLNSDFVRILVDPIFLTSRLNYLLLFDLTDVHLHRSKLALDRPLQHQWLCSFVAAPFKVTPRSRLL